MNNGTNDILIIGGGLGGLFTGAILAKEGQRVTVLEKNATIGGGLQSFRRFGETFDTGMHIIAGMQPGGNIRRICEYLGIMDKVRIMDVDDECTDALYFAEDRQEYRIAKGREGYVNSLARYFPDERANIEEYVNAIFRFLNEVPLFNLEPSGLGIPVHSEEFTMSADAFIAKYIKNPKLRSVMAYMNPLYGGRGNQTPAYIHAIISVLYISGTSRFVGGSSRFADLLAGVITANGGHVLTGEAVEWIEVEDRSVQFVRTKSGRQFRADYYISSIHPCTLFTLMPPKALPKAYRDRLNSLPNAYSAFSLYIKFKPESFPYINHSEFYMTKYADIWNFGNGQKPWPLGFLFMTAPDDNQGPFATHALVTAPMLFEAASRWQDTTVGRRGNEYGEWKKEKAEKLLSMIDGIHPGFKESIDRVNTASPLTIRDFYGVKDGSLCGFSKDYANLALTQVPVVTKVRNLLLTGQNVNLHGFCGVPLTAIQTSEAILGQNYVLNRINESVPRQKEPKEQ